MKYLSHDSRCPSRMNLYTVFLVDPNPKSSPNNPILHTPNFYSRYTLIANIGLVFIISYADILCCPRGTNCQENEGAIDFTLSFTTPRFDTKERLSAYLSFKFQNMQTLTNNL
jgi:hypothetical protein